MHPLLPSLLFPAAFLVAEEKNKNWKKMGGKNARPPPQHTHLHCLSPPSQQEQKETINEPFHRVPLAFMHLTNDLCTIPAFRFQKC